MSAPAEYTLYCFAQSGNAYKAALTLNLSGANWAPRFVDYFNGETRTPEYRAINVMGEVPLLEHKGRRFTQSGVIMDYLACTTGKFGWHNDDERREILRWLLWDNHKLTSYTATLRFMMQFVKTGETPTAEFLRQRMKGAFAVLNSHLADKHFVVADRPTIADISICGYLFWPEEFGVDWTEYANIARWLERIQNLKGWVHPYELMPGHPLPPKS